MILRNRYLEILEGAGIRLGGPHLEAPSGRIVARSRTSRTIQTAAGGAPDFFVKIYEYPRWRDRLRGILRNTFLGRSRAAAEWRSLGLQLRQRIPAVEPVAMAEERTLRLLDRCLLVTRAARGYGPADAVASGSSLADAPREPRARFVEGLARHTAWMHARRFIDGDYHLRNILARRVGRRWRFRNLDSPAGRLRRAPWGRHRGEDRDLATLERDARALFRRTERLRFLLEYLGVHRLTPAAKARARRVLRLARSLPPPRPPAHPPFLPS